MHPTWTEEAPTWTHWRGTFTECDDRNLKVLWGPGLGAAGGHQPDASHPRVTGNVNRCLGVFMDLGFSALGQNSWSATDRRDVWVKVSRPYTCGQVGTVSGGIEGSCLVKHNVQGGQFQDISLRLLLFVVLMFYISETCTQSVISHSIVAAETAFSFFFLGKHWVPVCTVVN